MNEWPVSRGRNKNTTTSQHEPLPMMDLAWIKKPYKWPSSVLEQLEARVRRWRRRHRRIREGSESAFGWKANEWMKKCALSLKNGFQRNTKSNEWMNEWMNKTSSNEKKPLLETIYVCMREQEREETGKLWMEKNLNCKREGEGDSASMLPI